LNSAVPNQRWRRRGTCFRPAGETINTREYEVAPLTSDRVAKDFVHQHHYSGSYPAARFHYGLYKGDQLCGVAVFSHPTNDRVITSIFPGNALDGVELGRFVLLDCVPANGETFFLGQCFRHLKTQDLRGVVSFSDPVPRTDAKGAVVFRGHIGGIYQAFNGKYLGRSTPRTLSILPDGTVFNARTIQKIRAGERGWQYAAAILQKHGATPWPGKRQAWLAMLLDAEINQAPEPWREPSLRMATGQKSPGRRRTPLPKTIGRIRSRLDWNYRRGPQSSHGWDIAQSREPNPFSFCERTLIRHRRVTPRNQNVSDPSRNARNTPSSAH